MSYFNDISFINASKRISSCYTSLLLENGNYSIEYIGEGSTYLTNNGKRVKLMAPVVFWMLPGNTYQFLPVDNKPVEHLWTDFYGARAERMLKCLNERIPAGMVTISRHIEFEMIFDEMIKCYNEHPIGRRYEAVVCLERLMGFIYSASLENDTRRTRYDFIADLADEIKFSPLKEYDFRKIAKENSISYDHFRILFRQYNGISPRDYLLQCQMEHAAKILQDNDILIKDLATLCGFNEISSFSRMFKRKMGVSPAKYSIIYKKNNRVNVCIM